MTGLGEILWLGVLGAPILSALAALAARRRAAERFTRVLSLVTLAAALLLLVGPSRGSAGTVLGWDATSDLFAALVAAVYALSAWYSPVYLASVRASVLSPSVYYALLSGFAAAMLGTLAVSNLALMWIGLEATTILSALLVMYDRRPSSVEAAWRYTLIASGGLAVGL
ncbi:hydrogenase 4 subunit F, partial [mine drainage metagenome]